MARNAYIGGLLAAIALLVAAMAAHPAPRSYAQTACSSQIDLVIVVDGSESISWSEFDLVQSFVSDVAASFLVSETDAHIGLVQFSGEGQGRIETGLTGNAGTIQAAIFGMPQIMGVTDIQEGIALGQGKLSSAGRGGVAHVIVVITDGEHNQPGSPIAEAEAARAAGTQIFAVGIGDGPKLEELNAIADHPGNVFSVSDFDALVGIISPLVTVVCPPTPTPSATPTAMPPGSTPTPPTGEEPPAVATSTVYPPGAEPPASVPGDPVAPVLYLPEVGNGLPPDLDDRGGHFVAQALGGLGAAMLILVATYWVARRRRARR